MLGIRHCVSGVLISLAPTPGSDIVFYRMRAEMKISLAEFFLFSQLYLSLYTSENNTFG